jgi:hypothetical protein
MTRTYNWQNNDPTDLNADITTSGQAKLNVADFSTNELLGQILIELKKLNLRQEAAFEETIHDGDV